jgi:Protein of unknown function (DUF2721)
MAVGLRFGRFRLQNRGDGEGKSHVPDGGGAHMDIVPDTNQLSQVMVQATAPAFILGAVAGFVSILLGRMTSVIDRIRSLNEIADGDTARAPLKSDIPRLRRRAQLLNSATRLALPASSIRRSQQDCPKGLRFA